MPLTVEEFPGLPYERFRFFIRITSRTILPPYKGSVFRGAFGNAFRKAVCIQRTGDCSACVAASRCLYRLCFEPATPTSFPDARKYSHPPTPYIIVPPLTARRAFEQGETLLFELVLLGPALEALPYFIFVFIEMGRSGLGRDRGTYHLERVDILNGSNPFTVFDGHSQVLRAFNPTDHTAVCPGDDVRDAVSLHLLTPLRLKVKNDLVTRLSFPLLFNRLEERLTLLAAFYGSGSQPGDASQLLALSHGIRVTEDALRWHEWERYSGRQKTTMKFGGLKGKITFAGPVGPFMPYLRLGEDLSVGQHTTFGLGRIRIIG